MSLRIAMLIWLLALVGCASARPGEQLARRGDEIVVCGQLFHTGAPVVLWMDPGGYDAYRVERRFVPRDQADWKASSGKLETPNRYGERQVPLTEEERDRVRGGGWDLDLLRRHVDQFVIHYDVAGTSRTCFRVLHDVRGLSIHFMLDIDGTIYQTLDVKERAWHATVCNDRSVGIEIANIGAYPPGKDGPVRSWYSADERGRTVIMLPAHLGDGGVRTPGFVGTPARPGPIEGRIHGSTLLMQDLTPEQYDSLAKLTATLCTVLPRVRCDFPRGADGSLITTKLPDDELATYSGLIGHYHIQANKVDPGPAFQWEMVVHRARGFMGREP
jgi:N-acetylmuramoyl-L-alanine amidase